MGCQEIFKCLLLSFPCESRGFELTEGLDIIKYLLPWLTPCNGTAIVCLWTASLYIKMLPLHKAEINFK